MKKCDKCKCTLEPNKQIGINYQTIELYDKEYDLCNSCCDDIVLLIQGKKVSDENPVEMDEALF
jgi:hypothetical protein